MRLQALLLLAVATIVGSGQIVYRRAARAQAPAERASPQRALEDQIRQSAVDFVAAYNAGQSEALGKLFTADAVFVAADGTRTEGRKAIQDSFAAERKESPRAATSVVVKSVRSLGAEMAIEEGESTQFPDGETATVRSSYSVVHLRRDGKWLMNSVYILKEEVISSYEYLRDLGWLAGEWIDESRDETVESSFRWIDDKRFLLQEFSVVSSGQVVLKGSQRIGWDPQARQIRSWAFDSGGGFGEARWTQLGNKWVAKSSGVRPDGASVSAVRTLEKVSRDRIEVTLSDRVAGDEQLPDVSVVMVRKPPQAAAK